MRHKPGWPHRRRIAVFAAALVILPVLLQCEHSYRPVPAWSLHGGPGLVSVANRTAVVRPDAVDGVRYVPGTSILRNAEGSYLMPGERGALVQVSGGPALDAAIAESRAWLANGTIPGTGTRWRDMGVRALLDIRALTTSAGGVVAAWHGPWGYVWPRDASFAAAAYCVTGHSVDGVRVLDFLARVQNGDGSWAARYYPDGRPVDDGRRPQLDATGWVPWAAWLCAATAADGARHWPMVRAAADAAVRSLGADGLPAPSPDYWEMRSEVTLGTAAPLLAGLRAATEWAHALGHQAQAMQYEDKARRLAVAIDTAFGAGNYQRRPDGRSGPDAAVTLLAPPFAAYHDRIAMAVAGAANVLTVPNGGVRPGEEWRGHPGEAWTPETALFALAAAASGDESGAAGWLDWLDAHRTALGALPERVSANGDPVSVAPLGWTGALVILALVALDESLPVPPE